MLENVHAFDYMVEQISGVSTVGPSGARAPLTFSLVNVIHVAYLTCGCYTHMNNFEMLVTLCSHESIFNAGHNACSISACTLARLVL